MCVYLRVCEQEVSSIVKTKNPSLLLQVREVASSFSMVVGSPGRQAQHRHSLSCHHSQLQKTGPSSGSKNRYLTH